MKYLAKHICLWTLAFFIAVLIPMESYALTFCRGNSNSVSDLNGHDLQHWVTLTGGMTVPVPLRNGGNEKKLPFDWQKGWHIQFLGYLCPSGATYTGGPAPAYPAGSMFSGNQPLGLATHPVMSAYLANLALTLGLPNIYVCKAKLRAFINLAPSTGTSYPSNMMVTPHYTINFGVDPTTSQPTSGLQVNDIFSNPTALAFETHYPLAILNPGAYPTEFLELTKIVNAAPPYQWSPRFLFGTANNIVPDPSTSVPNQFIADIELELPVFPNSVAGNFVGGLRENIAGGAYFSAYDTNNPNNRCYQPSLVYYMCEENPLSHDC